MSYRYWAGHGTCHGMPRRCHGVAMALHGIDMALPWHCMALTWYVYGMFAIQRDMQITDAPWSRTGRAMVMHGAPMVNPESRNGHPMVVPRSCMIMAMQWCTHGSPWAMPWSSMIVPWSCMGMPWMIMVVTCSCMVHPWFALCRATDSAIPPPRNQRYSLTNVSWLLDTRKDTIEAKVSIRFLVSKAYRSTTSGCRGTSYLRRYDREVLVLKPAILLKKSWGGGYRRTSHAIVHPRCMVHAMVIIISRPCSRHVHACRVMPWMPMVVPWSCILCVRHPIDIMLDASMDHHGSRYGASWCMDGSCHGHP